MSWSGTPADDSGAPDNVLNATSVASPCYAWAVGSYSDGGVVLGLILRWNGAAWAQVPAPGPGGTGLPGDLFSVAATSAGNAWAVGTFRATGGTDPLALHWDGTTWAQARTPTLSNTVNQLSAVGGSSASNIWAVGSYQDNSTSNQLALAIHYC